MWRFTLAGLGVEGAEDSDISNSSNTFLFAVLEKQEETT